MLILLFITVFSLSVFPAQAISWQDIFPPLQMSLDSKYGNPPAVNVKTIGPQGVSNSTYINKFEDGSEFVECNTSITTTNNTTAPKETILDKVKNIMVTIDKYPYNATDLNGNQNWEKLSTNFYRVAHYFNKGITYNDTEKISTSFKEFNHDGYAMLSRMFSQVEKQYLQSKAIEQVAKSLEKKNTDYADIQRAWDCNGKYTPMDNTTDYTTSCRPVTIGEIVYYYLSNPSLLKTDPLVFDDTDITKPKIIPEIFAKYPELYKKQYNKEINFLSSTDYQFLRDNLPIKASGPSMQEVSLTNYNSICNQAPNFKPCDPVTDTKQKIVPFGAIGDISYLNMISSASNQELPESEKVTQFTCDSVATVGPIGQDTPTPLSFTAFIKGLIKIVTDSPTFSYSYQNPVSVKIPKTTTDAVTITTNNLVNLFPDGYSRDTVVNTPVSCKVDESSPLDPGCQAEAANKLLTKYLYPQSWQDKYQF